MKNVIESIVIINGTGTMMFEVGKNDVAKIKDACMEFENSFTSMYLLYDKDEKLINSIENCPVVVSYV